MELLPVSPKQVTYEQYFFLFDYLSTKHLQNLQFSLTLFRSCSCPTIFFILCKLMDPVNNPIKLWLNNID